MIRARGFAIFIARVIAYVFLIGVAIAIAQVWWQAYALDSADGLATARDQAEPFLAISPLVCAGLGAVARPLGTFLVFFVAGAVITAPFALAHAIAH